MRSIALDIETTGLNPLEGHKIVEIGCVELIDNFPSGKKWQKYINPQRKMPDEAFKVHGLSEDFLSTKKVFSEVVNEFLSFIKEATLIIHNAKFDLTFINYELETLNIEPINLKKNKVEDTLSIAKKMFPGQSVSLDALCRKYKINKERKHHGALLDAELLAEVYLEMNGGRQQYIDLISNKNNNDESPEVKEYNYSRKVYKLTKKEEQDHKTLLEFINKY
jgi:DNA polymerase-3 subunit epsilon